jgi:aspartate dehydrogenase
MDKRMKIGMIGCGAIGTGTAVFIDKQLKKQAILAGIFDKDEEKAEALSAKLSRKPMICDLDCLFKKCSLIIECAHPEAVKPVLRAALKYKKNVVILSVRGLLKATKYIHMAGQKNIKIYLPSGAICGVDGVGALSLQGIRRIRLTTSKPPRGLAGASYLVKRGIELSGIKKPLEVFKGNVKDAIRHFPQNINVAATLALAAVSNLKRITPESLPVEVCIKADPGIKRNIHEIEIESEAANITIKIENTPSPENPKTSALASLSTQNLLRKILGNFVIGS